MSGLGVEDMLAEKWLKDTLSGDSTLMAAALGGIWDGPARDGTKYPIVRYDLQSAVETRTTDLTTLWLNMLWLIRGVAETTSLATLRTISNRINVKLHGSHDVAVTDGMIMWCSREQGFNQQAVENGREYRHVGGIYRIVIKAT